jgi:predicted DNA-binding antitoxin AbrB/MazE fold protein
MPRETLEAVYENGVFRPLKLPKITEGQQVRLIVEETSRMRTEDILNLAAQVYQGLSEEEIAEIEKIALDRRNFFGDRTN